MPIGLWINKEGLQSKSLKLDALRPWVEKNFFTSGELSPELFGDEVILYEVNYSGSVYDNLIDGFTPADNWFFSKLGNPSSKLLYNGLENWIRTVGGAWWIVMLDQDCVSWDINATIHADPERTNARHVRFILNWLLGTKRDDQGGSTCIGLLAHKERSVILFTNDYTRYKISFFGRSDLLMRLEECMAVE